MDAAPPRAINLTIMNVGTIRDTLLARPDQPHTLTLTTGEQFTVPHVDFVMFPGPRAGLDWFMVVTPGQGHRIVGAGAVASIGVPETAQA